MTAEIVELQKQVLFKMSSFIWNIMYQKIKICWNMSINKLWNKFL